MKLRNYIIVVRKYEEFLINSTCHICKQQYSYHKKPGLAYVNMAYYSLFVFTAFNAYLIAHTSHVLHAKDSMGGNM